MKFTIFKEDQPFVILWLEAETPQGEEANPYDYLNTLVEALADAYRCDFRWEDEKGKKNKLSSRILIYEELLFSQIGREIATWKLIHGDPDYNKEFPGLDQLIKTGYQDADNKP